VEVACVDITVEKIVKRSIGIMDIRKSASEFENLGIMIMSILERMECKAFEKEWNI